MLKYLLLIFLLFSSAARANWTGKDASGATITFFNTGTCTSVVCVPVAQPVDGSGAAFGVTGNPFFVSPASGAGFATSANQASQITQETATAGALGTTADPVATVPTTSTVATMISILKALTNVAASAVAAGTNYIGQFGAWVAPTSYVSGTTAAMTGTTSTQLLAAVASKKLYVLSISCVNSHATVGTFVTVQDGSGGTALATMAAAAVFGGDEKTSVGPLFSTSSGNGLYVADVTTGANVICNASGFAQ